MMEESICLSCGKKVKTKTKIGTYLCATCVKNHKEKVELKDNFNPIRRDKNHATK